MEFILRQILELTYCTLDVFLLFQFSKMFNLNLKIKQSSFLLISFLFIVSEYLVGYFLNFTSYNEIILVGLSIAYFLIIFRKSKVNQIYAPILFHILLGILTILTSNIFMVISSYRLADLMNLLIPRTLVSILIKTLMFIFILLLLKMTRNKNQYLFKSNIVLLYLVFVLFVLLITFEVIFLENNWLTESLLRIFFIVFISSFFVIIILFIRHLQNKKVIDEHRILIEEYRLKQQNYIYELQNHMSILKFKHDIRNHLIGIRSLIENKRYIGVIEYLDSIEKIDALKIVVRSNNEIVNAILNSKINEFPNIKFLIQTQFKDFILSMTETVIILGNSIDNAIEAVNKLGEGKRQIYINLSENNQFLKIVIENEYIGNLPYLGNMLLSSKGKNRNGFGLENIKQVVDSHHGKMEINTTNQRFKLVIILEKQVYGEKCEN